MSETQMNPTSDDFAALLDESMGTSGSIEGTVMEGKIISIENDFAIVDVGCDVSFSQAVSHRRAT